jgi:muramoyltetrapeptide carboxypeptidase
MMKKARRLERGDTIGLISPASATRDRKRLKEAVEWLEQRGFGVVMGKYSGERLGFLAGDDNKRLADLHGMFRAKRVNAVWCIRGGYGSGRLLDRIDYELIRENPKILIGFSDITALHVAISQRVGLVTFHGPMLTSHLGRKNCPRYTSRGVLETVMKPAAYGSIMAGSGARKIEIIRRGRASGALTGGNLSIIIMTMGTPFEIETKGKIVFLEEVEEAPYRIDRFLTQLLLAGKLADAAGIAIGQCAKCEPSSKFRGEYNQTAEDVFRERLRHLRMPIVMGLPFGHVMRTATLPMGVRATLDGERGDLIVEEAAVV